MADRSRGRVRDEMADVFAYLPWLADVLGLDLEEALGREDDQECSEVTG